MSDKLKKVLKAGAALFGLMVFGMVSTNITPPLKHEGTVNVEFYKVRPNDTFWDISHHYYKLDERNLYFLEYQDELREINGWLDDKHGQLDVGDVIQIRYVTNQK